MHLFATNLIVNRLEFPDLDNSAPKRDINRVDVGVFLPNKDDISMLKENSKVLVARVLVEFLECFR